MPMQFNVGSRWDFQQGAKETRLVSKRPQVHLYLVIIALPRRKRRRGPRFQMMADEGVCVDGPHVVGLREWSRLHLELDTNRPGRSSFLLWSTRNDVHDQRSGA